MHRIALTLMVLTIALAPLSAPPAPAKAQDCEFILGFLTLKNLIPEIVGDCVENVHFNPTNGDGLQMTTASHGQGGLLVWRKADNFTAFTDGHQTWINGPFGLQQRLNSQRFFWEPNPEELPIIPTPVAGEQCHTAGLSLALESTDAGAGNVVATFRFTNETNVSCTFFGFVGAQLLDAQNNGLPTNVVRGGGFVSNEPGPALITVAPGGSAIFKVHWGQVPVGDETTCPTATQIAVIPPDEFAPIITPAQITACGGGTLNVSAVTAPD